ncbi:uncharacterized protein ACJ7VT_019473 [Polymixia lowei]
MLSAVCTIKMLTGVPVERWAPCLLFLLLLTDLCLAAPGVPGTQREETADAPPPSIVLANPFGSAEEDRRLLQSYIQDNLKDDQGGADISTWEQEVFFLFRLYDYDRSGHMDGLEMMKLLSDYNSHNPPGAKANERVVSMVDFLLQTQDLNQDGLLAPSELLSPPLPHTQNSNNNLSHQKQEVAPEEKLSNTEKTGEEEKKAEGQTNKEMQPGGENTQQDEVKHVAPNQELNKQEVEPKQEMENQNELQHQQAPAAEQQGQPASVHLGQAMVSEVHKKISEAFEVFDHEFNKTVDVREIGTIIRSLGCFPTEAELHDVIAEQVEDPTGYICFERFLPTMTKILMERKFRPIPEDLLFQAFEVLDQQKKGHLEPEELSKYMTQDGEPFTQQEIEEMLSAAVDPEMNVIYYKDFVSLMTLDQDR